jgi:2-polyprenyl-3-methyl-5-hydroxy-6-metoxy-1,4-benzoquinol methylase
MTSISCPCCGHTQFRLPVSTDGGAYLCCRKCKSAFQKNVLEKSLIARDVFEQEQDKFYGDDSVVLSPAFEELQKEAIRRRYDIIRRFLKSGYLFEVGPGNGKTLSLFRAKGYQIDAIEHSETLADLIETATGSSVLHGDFSRLEIAQKYDAYMSFHVIEHIPDFQDHLAKAAEITKPGGFAFIATPNVRSLEHRVARGLAPGYSTAHIQLFSAIGMRFCLEKAGWQLVQVYTSDYPISWLRVLTAMIRKAQGKGKSKARGAFANAATPRMLLAVRLYAAASWPFRKIQGALGLGDELFIVARKR